MVKTSCPLELTFYLTGIRLFWAGGQNRDWEPQGRSRPSVDRWCIGFVLSSAWNLGLWGMGENNTQANQQKDNEYMDGALKARTSQPTTSS